MRAKCFWFEKPGFQPGADFDEPPAVIPEDEDAKAKAAKRQESVSNGMDWGWGRGS